MYIPDQRRFSPHSSSYSALHEDHPEHALLGSICPSSEPPFVLSHPLISTHVSPASVTPPSHSRFSSHVRQHTSVGTGLTGLCARPRDVLTDGSEWLPPSAEQGSGSPSSS
ncbi:hypothetical protein CRENBAI_017934 [Crenichthys baileyi]|uniref:Uncharacterized protein n=1 Tax=Crenichthys baileyi TaxID=28760 RepID=A0AAV9SKF8_9TELE